VHCHVGHILVCLARKRNLGLLNGMLFAVQKIKEGSVFMTLGQ
jgi:hypothetical protein